MDGVSAFIAGTIPAHPRLYSDVFQSRQFHFTSEIIQVPHQHFVCGSSIEFYIQPIKSCIDDIDTLISKPNALAISEDIPVLPDDVSGFVDTINCSQITPYPDYPGFVKLRILGKMRYNWNCKKFEFQKASCPRQFVRLARVSDIISSARNAEQERYCTGPAFKFIRGGTCPTDAVHCIWCPQWPKEAKHWPFRERRHGWPTSFNIRKIVRRGCHLVSAKHPACRNDVLQCRLSFSGAEVCLLQSWTPVQQIVYHMLRFFAKRELIKKDCPKEDEVLCTYHFKTLMLWSCEEMPKDWWNSLSVIEICCYILRRLSEWLEMRHCPNYFIPQANLFHECMNKKVVNETTRRLNELCHSDILSGWFADKYILPILRSFFITADIRDPVTDYGQDMLRVCEIMHRLKLPVFDCKFSVGFVLSVEYTIKDVIPQKSYLYSTYIQEFQGIMKVSEKTLGVNRNLFLSTVEFSTSFPLFVKATVQFACRKRIVLAASNIRLQHYHWICQRSFMAIESLEV